MKIRLPRDLVVIVEREGEQPLEEFFNDYRASSNMREYVVKYFEKRLNDLVKESEEYYDSPNQYNLLHNNLGRRAELRLVINLLKEGLYNGGQKEDGEGKEEDQGASTKGSKRIRRFDRTSRRRTDEET